MSQKVHNTFSHFYSPIRLLGGLKIENLATHLIFLNKLQFLLLTFLRTRNAIVTSKNMLVKFLFASKEILYRTV